MINAFIICACCREVLDSRVSRTIQADAMGQVVTGYVCIPCFPYAPQGGDWHDEDKDDGGDHG